MRIRTCPRCSRGLLRRARPSRHGIVDIDECGNCGGMFLDAGELTALTPESNLERLLAQSISRETSSGFPCPGCGSSMSQAHLEGAGKVVIDVCDTCSGMWLDGGELAALATLDGQRTPLASAFASLAAKPAPWRAGARRKR